MDRSGMRIAVVYSRYSTRTPSGESIAVGDQVEALKNDGNDVGLVERATDDERMRSFYGVRSALTVASGFGPDPSRELEAFAPDIVHVHNLFPNWGSRWMQKWADRVVVTLHNYRPICAAATLNRQGRLCEKCPRGSSAWSVVHSCYRGSAAKTVPLAIASRRGGARSPLLHHARHLVVLNQDAKLIVQAKATAPVSVIPNFVNPGSGPTGGTRSRRGWIYAGRLELEKGVGLLLRHWPHHRHLDVYGEGSLSDAVRKVAETHPETFTYHGPVRREQVLAALASAQGLVIPSLWSEGIPTILLESLAAGAPIVLSSACSVSSDLVTAGAAAVFDVHAPDPRAGLETALSRIEASGSAGARAHQYYMSGYTPDVWLGRMMQLYREVASGSC